MEPLLNDELKSVLDKIGFVNFDVEGRIELDGRSYGPIAEITPQDMRIIVDAVYRGKHLLQNNSIRITIEEFASHIPNPADAYKLMAALAMLRTKAGTRIYYVTPFGNYTSLHYQGAIQNTYIHDPKPEPTKDEESVKAKESKKPEDAKDAKPEDIAVTITEPVKVETDVESKAAEDKIPVKTDVKAEKVETKAEKPKASTKPAKSETKSKPSRTSSKRR